MQGKADKQAALDGLRKLNDVQRKLNDTPIEFEQWTVLYREKLEVERKILQTVAWLAGEAQPPSESKAAARGVTPMPAGFSTGWLRTATVPLLGVLALGSLVLWLVFRPI